jgi:hypothetical protein
VGVPLAGMGCAALADHLRAASWPSKFRLHLPEKYDGMSNPSEFLQVYVTTITAAGGNTAVMATYFHVALSGPARTWLMNLALGSIYSWEELCVQFVANFASAYQQHGVEAHLHAVRQEPGETLRTFISRFTKVRGTIPRISDASIITTFRQGVRDEKMLEKLATHNVETVSTLFALADKCARAAKGCAWHSALQTGVTQTSGSGTVPQDDKKKKKKDRDHQKPRSTALVVVAATGGRGDRNKCPRPQRGNSGSCPVHPNGRHSAAECREIIDLAKRVSEWHEQSSKDGSPPRRRPGKERVDDGEVTSGISHPRGPEGCLCRRLLLRWRQLDGPPKGPRTPRSTGPKPTFPRKPFWTPHGSRLLTSPCTNGYSMRTRTPSSNADGNPGSRPSPMASTKPRRAPQL